MAPNGETRERIMAAAFELFSARGYDQVSLNEIVNRAGVSKGGLFHHFDSKYSLARDSLLWFSEKMMGHEIQGMMEKDLEPEVFLTEFVDMMLDILEQNAGFTRFFWSVFDESLRKKEDHSIWVDFLESYVDVISVQYERMGVKNPRERALLFLAGMDGFAIYSEILGSTDRIVDTDRMKEAILAAYIGKEDR